MPLSAGRPKYETVGTPLDTKILAMRMTLSCPMTILHPECTVDALVLACGQVVRD